MSDATSTPSNEPGSAKAPGNAPTGLVPGGEGAGLPNWVGVRLIQVLALFLIAVAVVMVTGQMRETRDEPWRSPELASARAKLLADPKNEGLKTVVRELDRELRWLYFQRLERDRMGAWLLLGSGVVLVVLGRMLVAGPEGGGPVPGLSRWLGSTGSESPNSGRGRPGIAGVPVAWAAPDRDVTIRKAGQTLFAITSVWVMAMVGMGVAWRVRLPKRQAAASAVGSVRPTTEGIQAPPALAKGPSHDELAANWPRFRGFDGSGRVGESPVPVTWDTKTGDGVLWKAALPLKGYSSPVIWKDRVFVTGGNREQRRVFAFDAVSGAALWDRPVTPTNAPAPAIDPPDQSGQSASTPATDGERVYAIFATGELGALDLAGNLIWHQRLDFKENGYGHAASLVVWRDRLFVQADQGAPEDGKSVLLALESATGKTLWTAKRPVGGSWTTPLVIEVGGHHQVVTAGDPWLMAHDAEAGTEVWRAKVLGGELAPSPVYGAGRIVATSPGHALSAVAVDGTGDVTSTHVAWKLTEDVPDVPTPAWVGDLLFTANTEGLVICRDAGTGQKIWDHAFELEIQASPMVVGDRMYLFGQPGNVMVVKAGKTFESLAAFEMGEEIYATPAMAGGRLYLRTDRQLFCIGASSAPAKGETHDVR